MSRQHLLAACIVLSLSACDRPEPIEPVASNGSVAAAGAASDAIAPTPPPVDLPPVTDPSTSPSPAGTTPTAPMPAGTMSTDPLPPEPIPAAPETASAVVTLQPTSGSKVSGLIDLMKHGGGVHLDGRIAGLTPNAQHGFHVHETGDCSAPDASSAGGHFNPSGDAHGAHDAPSHHAGDLPSVTADAQGEADVDLMANGLEIGSGGPRDVIGRALVVHRNADDFRTQPDGAAGPRIGCGVIIRR